jgi:hypothetical protein
MTPGEGDVILCVLAHEGRDLRSLYPDATLISPDSRGLEGRRIPGRIFTTALATERPDYGKAVIYLRRCVAKAGGDGTLHHLDQPTVHAG